MTVACNFPCSDRSERAGCWADVRHEVDALGEAPVAIGSSFLPSRNFEVVASKDFKVQIRKASVVGTKSTTQLATATNGDSGLDSPCPQISMSLW